MRSATTLKAIAIPLALATAGTVWAQKPNPLRDA